jgi:hypothetical protein
MTGKCPLMPQASTVGLKFPINLFLDLVWTIKVTLEIAIASTNLRMPN